MQVEETSAEISTNMTLEADLATFNATAFRVELAAIYDLPLAYISLDHLSAGSIQIAITISIPPAAADAGSLDSDGLATASAALDSAAILSKVSSQPQLPLLSEELHSAPCTH